MKSAFAKDIARSIRGSLGRFLAIMGIVALGCGFYAGLQMCGPNMRADADALYTGTNLWDVRLISTMGFGDDDVERVRAVDGVSELMPSMTCDAMARLGEDQVAVRISSLDVEAAEESTPDGLYAVSSDDPSYLNRLRLVDGAWPHETGECVVSADAVGAKCDIGDKVVLLYGASSLDDLLRVDELTIVGKVSSSNYPYTGSFGSTTLGSGSIDQYLYVSSATLAEDAPYTEIYLLVESASQELSESDEYKAIVSATKDRLEGMEAQLASARRSDLQSEAQEVLDEKWGDYEEEKAKAESELDDAKAELDDAKSELEDGEKELADGESEYEDGKATYESKKAEAEQKLADGEAEIESNQQKLDEKRGELESGRQQLKEGQAAYEAGLQKLLDQTGAKSLDEAQKILEGNAAQADSGIARLTEAIETIEALPSLEELESAKEEAQAGVNEASAAVEQCQEGVRQADEGIAAADEAIAQCDSGIAQADGAIAECEQGIRDADTYLAILEPKKTELEGTVASLRESKAGLEAALESMAEDDPERAQTEAMLAGVDAGLQEAQAGLDEVDANIAATQEGKAQAEAGIASAEEGKATAVAGRAEAEEGKAKAEAGKATAEEGLTEAQAGLAQAQSGLEQVQEGIDARKSLAGLKEQLKEAQAGRAQVDEGLEAIATLRESKKQLDGSRATIDSGQTQLDDGQAQLDSARKELAESRVTAQEELDKAASELDDAATKLEDARTELAEGRGKYEDGLKDYEDGKRDADKEFAKARGKLEDAQGDIDDMDTPDIYALDRSQSEGAATYHADAGRMDNIAAVFPFMFFLVAALVALTTMTRMVEDDRVMIGTYKALGYSTAAIASKYLAYAGAAGTVGAVIGIVVLSQVLPYIVMFAYSIIYTVPIHPFPLPINIPIALSAGGLGVGVTLLATWGAVVSSLREVPATLMLPRAPKAGKRILLERVGPLWRRLSFTSKVTCRNLFRYKRRFLMTVIGISGCTALLLVGFGLHDSIWDIIDRQYGPIIHFDTTVSLDDEATAEDAVRVASYLESTGEVSDIVRVQNENMQAGGNGPTEPLHVNVVIPYDIDGLLEARTFRNRLSGEPLEFNEDSVIVTEKLALKYELEVGDVVRLYDQDDVGNAIGEGYQLKVTGIAENYVGNLVYVGASAWSTIKAEELPYTTLYATTTADEHVRKSIAEELHDVESGSTVIYNDETISTYRRMLSVVDMIVVVLIVSAAALAYIVLYNLTNINVDERVREIASLKVLGFTRNEVYAYIFREIGLLAAIGDMLGMVLGIFLERFVVTTAEVDYVMFGRSIHPPSFCYAFVLTLVFTGLVVLMMRSKLDRIDMVESLKSVD